MIGLKKKSKAKKKAAAEQAAQSSSSSSGEAKNDNEGAGKIGGLLGVTAGRKGKKRSKRVPAVVLRLQKDIKELDGGDVAKVSFPDASNLKLMNCSITPNDGYWLGATYNFTIDVPDDYPHKAPTCTLKEKIYHPNIDLEGNVCLNILRADWKPVLDINAVIYGLIFLLNMPNGDDPLNHDAARHFRENPASFKESVRGSLRGQSVRFGGKTVSGFPRLV
jgi:ubiquitin-conjugating enzyme E2 M|tara:strand:- start:40 stop:699 length:660 start_codon:yes stop_codon:yes gene_type:complete